MTSLPTSLLIFLAIELMVMDTTQFRERFKAWKDGKKPYQDGLPAYGDGKQTKKKWKYTPSDTVRSHIAKWEDSDFAEQNKQFGGDAVGAKAIEFANAIGEDIGRRLTSNELDGIFSTFYNLSPKTFNEKILPSIKKYAMDPNVLNRNELVDTMSNRYTLAAQKYQKGIKRRAAADTALTGLTRVEPQILEYKTKDGNKVMKFDYGQQFQPQPIPKPIPETQYPLNGSQAPESLSSWNAAQSPSTTPTIPSIQKLNNERQKAVQGAFQLPEVTVLGNRRTSLLPKMPSLNDALMAYSPQNQMNRAMSEMMGLDDLWEDFDVTSDLFKAKNGKLPRYKWGFGPINIWGSLKGAAKMLRDRMYRTVTPSGYTTEQVKNFITGKKRQGYQDPNTEAVYGMYTKQDSIDTQRYGDFLKRNNVPHRVVGEDAYGEPIQRVAVKDLIVPSTVEQGAYEFKYPNLPGQYPLVPKGTVGESKWLHSHTLGGYEKGTSADNNGTYDYYKDRWDINPFKGVSSTQDESPLFKAGNAIGLGYFDDIVPWGNPVNIHGKVYQKDNNPDMRPTEEKWKLFGSYKNGKTPKLKYRQ